MATHFFSSLVPLVVVLIFPVATMADPLNGKLWNIDCGFSGSYTTTNNNLSWIGDGDYVRTGESYEIASKLKRLQTLRAFPTGKKNCFSVPVGANTKVRVIAEFYYGNYDGLSKAPAFSLLFDTFNCGVIEASNNPDIYDYVAINYVTKSSNTSICLAKLYADQVPFISAIQVIALDPGMYPLVNSTDVVLAEKQRVAFGANTTIRHPDDHYDRRWERETASVEGFNYTIVVNNGTGILNTSSSVDNPPSKLFNTAAAPPKGEKNLTIRAPYITTGYFYFNMYFSEFSDLSASKLHRTFNIYFNDSRLTSDPVVPPFKGVLEISGHLLASADTKFTLVPADNSSLPPIISGFELLSLLGFMASNGTYHGDVDALTILQDKFQVLQNWSGDPCLPVNYNWEWVKCSSDDPPRITALSLSGYGLSGSLPDFSGLGALRSIDLHNNNLTGDIPEFLGKFLNLTNMNLADNNFSSIPQSLVNNPKIRSLNITGNPLLEHKEGLPPPLSPNSNHTSPSDGNICSRYSGSAFISIMLLLCLYV